MNRMNQYGCLMALILSTTAMAADPIPEYTIAITAPLDQGTITTGADSLQVSVAVEPGLAAEDSIVVKVDGVDSAPQHSTDITLPRLDRGAHTIQAVIVQPNGKGAETGVITVFQQRASVLLNQKK